MLEAVEDAEIIEVSTPQLEDPLHLEELGVTWSLSRDLGNVPSDPLMKGLGCNVRAIGPNDGA